MVNMANFPYLQEAVTSLIGNGELVILLHMFDPGICLVLGIQHERPQASIESDQGTLDAKVVVGQPVPDPVAHRHRIADRLEEREVPENIQNSLQKNIQNSILKNIQYSIKKLYRILYKTKCCEQL